MEQDTEKTRVIFKITPATKMFPVEECIAFFPDELVSVGAYISSYMHVGQHGEASISFMEECRPAGDGEYEELKKELESIGYNLVPCN